MKKIEMFLEDSSDLAELTSQNKGYRTGIYIRYNNNVFKLTAYDTTRIIQDFQDEYEQYGFFAIDPNLILVKSVTIEQLFFTITKLEKQRYFENIKPETNVSISELIKVRESEIL